MFVGARFNDLILLEGFGTHIINNRIDTFFNDQDGDLLTYRVTSSGHVIDPSVLGDTFLLREGSLSPGIASITVVAADGYGGVSSGITFSVEVRPNLSDAFITTWDITAGDILTIPTRGGVDISDYGFWIYWGDGSPPENITGDNPRPSHTYATTGIFTVWIAGTFPYFYLNNDLALKGKLLSIEQWGNIAWESMDSSFYGANNLVLHATDIPNLSHVEGMANTFRDASAFNGDLSSWKVDSVTNMSGMFSGASSFNSDLSQWNVSKVSDFDMFLNGSNFSTYHYDTLLISWNKLDLQKGMASDDSLIFDAVVLKDGVLAGDRGDTIGIQYRLRAQAARNSIITGDIWSIRDGGLGSNNTPVLIKNIPDLVLEEGFLDTLITTRLDTFFRDEDNDFLFFTAFSKEGIVELKVNGDTLTVLERLSGMDSITLRASDGYGGSVINKFIIDIIPSARNSFVTTWDITTAGDSPYHTDHRRRSEHE